MLTDEVATFGKPIMKIAHLTLALVLASTATACVAERAVSPHPVATQVVAVSSTMSLVPLLYIVDGVRLQRDQVPTLTRDEISAVQVVKGNAALREYGPDASYGVVLITTKAAAAPRS
jgi:hypothetical protein